MSYDPDHTTRPDLDGPTPAQQRAAALVVSDAALRLSPTREQAADDLRQVLDALGLTEGAQLAGGAA